MAAPLVIPLFDPPIPRADLSPKEVEVPNESGVGITLEGGTLKIPLDDGGITIDFNPQLTKEHEEDEFGQNLADTIDDGELSRIANELLEAIDADDQSRSEWLETRARGITLLGLKLEDPHSATVSSAPLEGQSTVRHPVLLEAVLRFAANARGEILPASGPAKVRHDLPPKPDMPIPAQGEAEVSPEGQYAEDMATALEADFNHYLTTTASEYYPDTDRMLFITGFGGLGVKKVYNCPLRRRPVIESVDAKDFIVSDATSDLSNAGRVTHRIMMRPSTLKRMQIVGAYRDVTLNPNTVAPTQNVVDEKISEVQGVEQQPTVSHPEDVPQELYESYCELNISGYEHKDKGKVTGLRVPYKVTIHKESRQILEIRRNWDEEDPLCMPREYFVCYMFMPGFGFYPIGLLHILGNATVALTAAWREMLDAGMFANFPGFLVAKQAGRQLTNQLRVPPGGAVPIDIGMGSIQDAVMPLPYKEVGPSFTNFIQRVEELSQRIGGTAELQIGEGKQDAPVGTTLALIEQSTKMMDSVHKRLHAAQAKELQLLKERFKEDPEAFWRHNKRPRVKWSRDMFLAALEDSDIVPVSDPNNPTSLHRVAKAAALGEIARENPLLFDQMAVAKRVLRIANIDAEGLFLPQPAPAPPDPRLEAVKGKQITGAQQASAQIHLANIKRDESLLKAQVDREKIQSQERQAVQKAQSDQWGNTVGKQHEMALKEEQARREAIHKERKMTLDAQWERQRNEMRMRSEQEKNQNKMIAEQQKQDQQLRMQERQNMIDEQSQARQMQLDDVMQRRQMASDERMTQHREGMEQRRAESKLEAERAGHEQGLRQKEETHKADLTAKKQMAKVKPAAKPKKST